MSDADDIRAMINGLAFSANSAIQKGYDTNVKFNQTIVHLALAKHSLETAFADAEQTKQHIDEATLEAVTLFQHSLAAEVDEVIKSLKKARDVVENFTDRVSPVINELENDKFVLNKERAQDGIGSLSTWLLSVAVALDEYQNKL